MHYKWVPLKKIVKKMSQKVDNKLSYPTLKDVAKYLDAKAKNEDKYWRLVYWMGSEYKGFNLDTLFFKGNKYMAVKLAMTKFKDLIIGEELDNYDYGKDGYQDPQYETLEEAIEEVIKGLFENDSLWFEETKKPILVTFGAFL